MQKNITQLHNITPEEFKTEILRGVKELLLNQKEENNLPEKALTRKEVAKLLCISLPTLRSYVKRGIVKEHRKGARVLYYWSEIMPSFSKDKN